MPLSFRSPFRIRSRPVTRVRHPLEVGSAPGSWSGYPYGFSYLGPAKVRPKATTPRSGSPRYRRPSPVRFEVVGDWPTGCSSMVPGRRGQGGGGNRPGRSARRWSDSHRPSGWGPRGARGARSEFLSPAVGGCGPVSGQPVLVLRPDQVVADELRDEDGIAVGAEPRRGPPLFLALPRADRQQRRWRVGTRAVFHRNAGAASDQHRGRFTRRTAPL